MILPINYTNVIIEKNENFMKCRSSIANLVDYNNWVVEFGKINNFKWNSRSSTLNGKKITCSLVLIYKFISTSIINTILCIYYQWYKYLLLRYSIKMYIKLFNFKYL
jgi:hypothetical protein